MVFRLLLLVEPGVQGMYFLGQQILGLMELPEVFFLSLVSDGENKGNELIDSSDLGQLGPRVACHFGDVPLGELHLQVVQMIQQLFLLVGKVLSIGFGHSCTSGCQLLPTLRVFSTFQDTCYFGPTQIIQDYLPIAK